MYLVIIHVLGRAGESGTIKLIMTPHHNIQSLMNFLLTKFNELCVVIIVFILNRAANDQSFFTIMERTPTRAFSWLKAATTAFTFKTLLRHYAKRALTPR